MMQLLLYCIDSNSYVMFHYAFVCLSSTYNTINFYLMFSIEKTVKSTGIASSKKYLEKVKCLVYIDNA